MKRTTISESLADDPAVARAKALELLARREHARRELHQKLCQRGFSADTVEAVLDQLTDEGFLNERRYAEIYARSRANKGYGSLRIARELRERGISQDRVEEALAELVDDWLTALRNLHRKRFKSQMPTDHAERMRQIRVLRQHGFTQDQIQRLFEIV